MPNSYRIRTQVGVDKSVRVLLEQDFEQLEILSLKILQNQIYTRQCSDYGVIVGRISANDGFGLPNCKVSVFIPLTSEDESNPVISELYPYRTIATTNEDGFRYNLLPYVQSYSGHVPTGSFPDREDVLTDPSLIEVYNKYYKFTTQTNDSGDYMIFGVPVGVHAIHVDIDLSDIGEFSLSPQDLIRMGLANESQVAGVKFKSSSNLNSLPQILTFNRSVTVEPFWGEPEICTIGITRSDFDITQEANISITPTAIFMGSIFSSNDKDFQKVNCKPKIKQGELCNLVAGPGEILAIRQTIGVDNQGRPVLEVFDLDAGGQVIDDNGTWLLDVPMNLDYVITNEFGERVLSNDPKVGIPTKGKYRFKIKWNQSPKLSEPIKRAYFLVPNIREYGWNSGGNADPLGELPTAGTTLATKSYAFSLDWNDYADINAAINCEDTFYLMSYNKVYTVSQLIDQYRKGYLPNRIIAIRNILDDVCESDNVRFPTNDAIYRFDLLYLLFVISTWIFIPIIYILLVVAHLLAALLRLFGNPDWRKIANMQLPNLSYPDCDLCECEVGGDSRYKGATAEEINQSIYISNYSFLTPVNQFTNYNCSSSAAILRLISGNNTLEPAGENQAPQQEEYSRGSNIFRDAFTTSIPIHERINLFNSKAKYFDDLDNPGGGWNRIKVNFRPTLNGYSNQPNAVNSSDFYLAEANSGTYSITSYSGVQPLTNQTITPPLNPTNPFNTTTSTYTVQSNGTYQIDIRIDILNQINDINNVVSYSYNLYQNNNMILTYPGGVNFDLVVTSNYDPNANPVNEFPSPRTVSYTLNAVVGDEFQLRFLEQYATGTPPPLQIIANMKITPIGVPTPLSNLKYHMDNCLLMLVKPDRANSFIAGSIFTFQDPFLSSDPNITGGTLNIYGTNGITGTPINNTGTINVDWADYTGNGNTNRTVYNISQTDIDAQYAKYAMDVEYFQVITAITVSQYIQLCNSTNVNPLSFQKRVIENKAMIYKVRLQSDPCFDMYGPSLEPTLECYNDYGDQVIVIMNRGVDPYSSRGEVEYDLSILFSYPADSLGRPTGQVKIRGNNYKLNIPIQGHYGCVRHNKIDSAFTSTPNLDVTGIDTIMQNFRPNGDGSSRLYFSSYHFQPSTSQFIGFTSTLPSYYLSSSAEYVTSSILTGFMGTSVPNINRPCSTGDLLSGVQMESNYKYIRMKDSHYAINLGNGRNYNPIANSFMYEFTTFNRTPPRPVCFRDTHNENNSASKNRGYFPREIIDGSSFMNLVVSIADGGIFGVNGYHYSPAYIIQNYNFSNCVINNRIVMRSDRLPTSTFRNTFDEGNGESITSFALHQNNLFSPYLINDDGSFELADGSPAGTPQFSLSAQTQDDQVSGLSITSTFSCQGMVPLGCYYTPATGNQFELNIKPSNDVCYQNGADGQIVMKNGCYILITTPLESLPRDFVLLGEWSKRLSLTFAACRNIFSHVFTNNWINGSLYAFSFSNQRIFDSVNQPRSRYCKDTVFLHPTNNFYYRSSPFYTGTTSNRVSDFVGAKSQSDIYKGNKRFLKFPTTIIDLGPRNEYMQELIYTDEFDGYMVNRLTDTSYQDVSDLLNLLFLNRLTNLQFYADIVTSFFVDRKESINFIDGDYSQMISINSELGVVELETSNYLPIDNKQDPIYFSNANSIDPIFGVFFSSDTQTRDYVTPKRTIINPNISPTYPCAFSNFTVFSQLVPFYQWTIKENRENRYLPKTIFGSQQNDWYTERLGTSFFAEKYQEMDRTSQSSRYFRSTSSLSIDYKGYIYSYDRTITSPTFDQYNINVNSWERNISGENNVTVGAPFHFYFGLKKGKTSWDRFVRKWINTSNITE